ncbi:MAG: alpha/beta hydrolase [Pseudomonadota bacterium]
MTSKEFQSKARRLAYDQTPGHLPGVVFLGGFNSSKDGTKATHLEAWAREAGHSYLRFDYSGHGASSGAFEDGTIGQWLDDAAAIIDGLTKDPQIIVGSSMGGWLACLLLKRMPERFLGLVTIAAAPDFTENRYWAGFDSCTRERLLSDGFVDVDSPYDVRPYRITKALIEEGRAHLILSEPLVVPCPMRILHGSEDAAIPVSIAQDLFNCATGPDIRLTLVKGADHRFSTPECLRLVTRSIEELVSASSFTL